MRYYSRKTVFTLYATMFILVAILLLLVYGITQNFDQALYDGAIIGLIWFLFALLSSILAFHYHAKNAWNPIHGGWVIAGTLVYLTLYKSLALFIQLPAPNYAELVLRAIIVGLSLYMIVLYWWIARKEQIDEKIAEQMVHQERLLAQSELEQIHQQIQPHFLFNSLNSISALTQLNPQEANRMIHLLSSFLRNSLHADLKELVTLESELEQTRRYLEIEAIRFGDRLQIDWNLDENSSHFEIPPLILQPVIENAIKFGLYGHTGRVHIRISSASELGKLKLTISNPYDPQWVNEKKGKGIGLKSIAKRLELRYKQNMLLQTKAEDSLFTTTIYIPQ
jgi:sensor histidine kinase YesM